MRPVSSRTEARRPRRRSEEGGAAAVEFALIMPVFLAVLFGIIDFGWYFYQRFALVAAVRDGIRAGLAVPEVPVPPKSTKSSWTTAQERAAAVLAVGKVITGTVTWGPEPDKRYKSAPPTKTLTLSGQYTYVPLIGFTPLPKLPMSYSMTMYLEAEN